MILMAIGIHVYKYRKTDKLKINEMEMEIQRLKQENKILKLKTLNPNEYKKCNESHKNLAGKNSIQTHSQSKEPANVDCNCCGFTIVGEEAQKGSKDSSTIQRKCRNHVKNNQGNVG